MIDWEWLGINSREWSPQKLDYLAFIFEEWLGHPWFARYATLRNMAGMDWTTSHNCPVSGASSRNKNSSKGPWIFISGALACLPWRRAE